MSNNSRFLVVDDDPAVARVLVRALRSVVSVDVASTVSQAKKALSGSPALALILDAKLPDGSGFEVLHHARMLDPFVKALIISGDPSVANGAFDAGAAFVLKPVEASRIVTFAKRAIALSGEPSTRVRSAVSAWTITYKLTKAETALLQALADGAERSALSATMGKTSNTIKTQIRSLLAKTGRESLRKVLYDVLRDH